MWIDPRGRGRWGSSVLSHNNVIKIVRYIFVQLSVLSNIMSLVSLLRPLGLGLRSSSYVPTSRFQLRPNKSGYAGQAGVRVTCCVLRVTRQTIGLSERATRTPDLVHQDKTPDTCMIEEKIDMLDPYYINYS